jgi:hypothetical protein
MGQFDSFCSLLQESKPIHVASANVSLPIEIEHKGKLVETGIFKKPIAGPVRVSKENLAGDRQADLVNHGGRDKAVYAYSYESYSKLSFNPALRNLLAYSNRRWQFPSSPQNGDRRSSEG